MALIKCKNQYLKGRKICLKINSRKIEVKQKSKTCSRKKSNFLIKNKNFINTQNKLNRTFQQKKITN